MKMRMALLINPRSLKYQLLFRTLFILAILLVLIGVFQYAFMKDFLYGNKAASIETQIDTIPKPFWQNVSKTGSAPDKSVLFALEAPGSTISFFTPMGKFLPIFVNQYANDIDDKTTPATHSGDVDAPRLPEQTYRSALTSQTDMTYQVMKDNNGKGLLVVLHRIGDRNHPIGLVQVSTPARPLEDILIKQLTIFGFLVACALFAGLLTFLPLLRRTLDPLSRMVHTVSKINAGNLDERFSNEHAQTEITLLASSFNAMLERLETSFEAERIAKERMHQFVADASHELRTPLAVIHGFIEVLLRGAARKPALLERALRSMHGESDRVNKLVQDLLFLARQDREPSFNFSDTRLDVLMIGMEPELRLLAGDRKVSFVIPENITVHCDPDRIKQVILNLFHNAIQYTDSATGQIEVSLTKDFAGARIGIRDNGIGIPKEHQAQLFERFYRVDQARSRQNGGVGLGLSITKSIVDHHGGTISLKSEVGEGTAFYIWLPLK
jgi:two-component system, OmpR family, sensor kinase